MVGIQWYNNFCCLDYRLTTSSNQLLCYLCGLNSTPYDSFIQLRYAPGIEGEGGGMGLLRFLLIFLQIGVEKVEILNYIHLILERIYYKSTRAWQENILTGKGRKCTQNWQKSGALRIRWGADFPFEFKPLKITKPRKQQFRAVHRERN